MIKVENVEKYYGKIKALNGISLNVKDGSIYGLIGTNGSGKSTLLRTMAGIFRAEKGKIEIDGENIYENPILKRRIVYISDDQFIIPSSTAEDVKDFYKNIPNLEIFGEALAISKNSVCYNGDIFSADDFKRIHAQFPNVECFMMGRGILADPSLAREIRGGKAADQSDIRRFHDLLYHTYREEVSGDRNVLFKMKEIWFYLAPMFADSKKYAKKIKKSEKCVVYESAVNELFANCRFTGTQSK